MIMTGSIINEGFLKRFQYQDNLDADVTFINGITQNELEGLIDQETYIYPKLMRNITIYIIVDVLFGSLLYFLIKQEKITYNFFLEANYEHIRTSQKRQRKILSSLMKKKDLSVRGSFDTN